MPGNRCTAGWKPNCIGSCCIRAWQWVLSCQSFRCVPASPSTGNTIPGVPDRMFFLSLYAATSQGIYLMPSWRYSGRMAMNDANSRFNSPWSTADLVAGYKPRMPNRLNLDIFVRIKNLFDEKYASMILVNAPSFGSNPPRYYYPGLPRHFIVGLRMGLWSYVAILFWNPVRQLFRTSIWWK